MGMLKQKFPVLLHPGEDGFVIAECPSLPGCFSQGRDEAEALKNIREAIELCLEDGAAPQGAPQADEWKLVPVEVGGYA
jgi:predicted RNase H-like HicB family nuclease